MPKSKRDKKISLTKTDKKGLALKQKIIENVRNYVEQYSSIYVFTFRNMRNEMMKQVREDWKPSKFLFGNKKVFAVGLGRTQEEEIQDDLHKLAKCLKGECALLFTDSPKNEVVEWFESYSCEDFARSGFVVNKTITLPEGPLKDFAHSMEPYLRKLNMPTKLERGVITLIKDFTVCTEGTPLTPEQAKILELLKIRLATFKLGLKACWIKGEGFERLDGASEE